MDIPKAIIIFALSIYLSGCSEIIPNNSVEIPLTWKESCNYQIKAGQTVGCQLDASEVYINAPSRAVCTASYVGNGASISFKYDFLEQTAWVEFTSLRKPISGYFYTPDTNELVYFLDSDDNGAIILPWSNVSRAVDIAIYWDFLYYNNIELGPSQGKQIFTAAEGELYTITEWKMNDENIIYVGYEENGLLHPRGVESWIDNSGSYPSVTSMKKFLNGSSIPTNLPQSCIQS